jgi:hypothetical protein
MKTGHQYSAKFSLVVGSIYFRLLFIIVFVCVKMSTLATEVYEHWK